MRKTSLRLVFDAGAKDAEPYVSAAPQRAGELQAEVTAIEVWHGKNAYSDFLAKHERRPDPAQAATIGRLIGARVKASDGRMYPAQNAAERKAHRAVRQEALKEAKGESQLRRFRKAVSELATNTIEPAELIRGISGDPDGPGIREQLQDAIRSLTRFAEEWQRRETCRTN
jgi:hypothetical protein